MNAKVIFGWFFKIVLLVILYFPIWILGTLANVGLVPDITSDPGLVSDSTAMLILGIINTILIVCLIVSSRWYGWRLALFLFLAYYGSFTFLTQIESWFFLLDVTISQKLLSRLFIMGLSIPLIYIPLAILICKRWKKNNDTVEYPSFKMPVNQLFVKLGILSLIYVAIYFLAGYFIAWQNPQLRAFYNSPGELMPFFTHTFNTLSETPSLFFLQLFRGALFALIVLPIINGSKLNAWMTGVLVGFLLATPHLVHIMSNPLIPDASVRFSHMIETFSSNFVFGLIIVWLLHCKHHRWSDLFSMKSRAA